MPAVSAPAKVLVTGASGFVASWIIRTLLERRYKVIGTVRSPSKGEYLKKHFAKYGEDFGFVIVGDMEKEGAYDEAVKDTEAVFHTASPVHENADDPSDIIDPAVNGTVNILKSIAAHGPLVKRVVVTSSMSAVYTPRDKATVFTEANWNTHDVPLVKEQGSKASGAAKYNASKTLAEQAAWEFVREHGEAISFDLVVVAPPWVFGPFFHEVSSVDRLNGSLSLVRNGIFPQHTPSNAEELSNPRGSWVDVREVASAQVEAIENERAGGERFIVSVGPWSVQDILDIVHAEPSLVPDAPKGVPGAGAKRERSYGSGQKTGRVLGVRYRGLRETVEDTIGSLRERGWAETA